MTRPPPCATWTSGGGPLTSGAGPAWRLLRDGDGSGGWNMGVDAGLLACVEAGSAPPTVRVYGWDGVWVSLGRFQTPDRSLNLTECRRRRIGVVRRPTGGRAVLHGTDITVTLCAPYSALPASAATVAGLYRWGNEALARGLSALGLATSIGGERYAGRGGDCFAASTAADLSAGAGKVLGSAQRRGAEAVLVQMSLRWRPPVVDPACVFGDSAAAGGYPLADCPRASVETALLQGLCAAIGDPLAVGARTEAEMEFGLTPEAWCDII